MGPLLFTLYINDIGGVLKHAEHLLYADDTKIFRIITDVQACLLLQQDLCALTEYCKVNQLFLNASKCSVITYTRKIKPLVFPYTLHYSELPRVNTIRDLGILMDSNLTYNSHIDSIVNRAFRNLGFINRVSKPFQSINTIKILYYSFIRSILEFASVVWSPCYHIHIKRIEQVQEKFLKSLSFKFHYPCTSYDSRLKHFNLTPLSLRRKLMDLTFLYKILNGKIICPSLLCRIPFTVRSHGLLRSLRPLRNRNKLFILPNYNKNYTRNSYMYRTLHLYNSELSASNIDPFNDTIDVFKSKILKHLNH